MRRELTSTAVTLTFCIACGSSTPDTPMSSAGSAGSAGQASMAGGGQNSSGAGGGNASAGGGGAGGSGGSGGSSTPMAGAGGSSGSAGLGGAGGSGGSGGAVTPPEGVPANYELVYEQSFAEPASLGDLVFANPTQWQHNAAGYLENTGSSYAPPYRSPFSVAIVKSIKVQSFVMDVEMLQTSPDGDAHRDMTPIWSFVNPSQFYYAHISTAHDGVAHNIHIVDNADRTAITDVFTAGYDWGRDVWKKLRVVHDTTSGDMKVFDLDVPAEPILTANDTTFTGGYVGFGSFDNKGNVRNVKVWAEASTPGSPDFFSPAE